MRQAINLTILIALHTNCQATTTDNTNIYQEEQTLTPMFVGIPPVSFDKEADLLPEEFGIIELEKQKMTDFNNEE